MKMMMKMVMLRGKLREITHFHSAAVCDRPETPSYGKI